MREGGLEAALGVVGGVGKLARMLGISQPAVSSWRRVPAERVIPIETLTGVPRSQLRPDLYPPVDPALRPRGSMAMTSEPAGPVDEIDLARSHEYAMLALLLGREPSADTLQRLAGLGGDASPLGMAHIALAEAAAAATPVQTGREYFRIFVGVGRGELLAYASYYLTGFVHERPLAHVRADLARLGIARSDAISEPEDHIAILCEVMSGLASGQFPADAAEQKQFFKRHLQPWAPRFFADLETSADAPFYRCVGAVGRTFLEIETEAFEIED